MSALYGPHTMPKDGEQEPVVPESKGHDFREMAPRWFLVLLIAALLAACMGLSGYAFGKTAERDREQSKIAERVSVLEIQITRVSELSGEMRELRAATNELTAQLRGISTKLDNRRQR